MDFKGPVAKDYNLHMMIDNLSHYPVVQVVQSTKFLELRLKLDEVFAIFWVPVLVTHDGGVPYSSDNWRTYTREQGFESILCTPENPEANGLAKRFMGVMIKTIHAAKVENKDHKLEIERRLMNYRNTPHPATGKVPAELVFRRTLMMKIPRRPKLLGNGDRGS